MIKLREDQLTIASQLNQKFENIEEESGIFLIRPNVSYHGKYDNLFQNKNFHLNLNFINILRDPSDQLTKLNKLNKHEIKKLF